VTSVFRVASEVFPHQLAIGLWRDFFDVHATGEVDQTQFDVLGLRQITGQTSCFPIVQDRQHQRSVVTVG
jgi:hypothetical protein